MIRQTQFLTLLLSFLLTLPAAAQNKKAAQKDKSAGKQQEQFAVKQLITDADIALKSGPFSVVDNPPVPPSQRKNDFYSWAPYLWPNPDTKDGYPYIGKDGKTNPETERVSDKPLLRKMAVNVNALALAYTYSKNPVYAKKSVALLQTWFLNPETKMNPNLDYGQCTPGIEKGTATGIIDSRWLILVVDAIPALRKSGALSSGEENELKKWFGDYLTWLRTSAIGIEEGKRDNNHGSWYAAQAASFALFTGNKELAKTIVADSKHFFGTQIDSLGRQKHELHRTKSFDYSLYNLHALITLAKIGDQVGVDLWHYNAEAGSKKNIQESIRYLAGFGTGEKAWPFQQIAEKAVSLNYEDGDHFSVYYPYDLYSALRIGYDQYRDPAFLEIIGKLPVENTRINRANLSTGLYSSGSK